MPRQARLDSAGTLHHVMVRGIEKRTIVADERDRKNFVLRLGRLAHESGTLIYAWALMSDHAHILLRSGPHGLAKFIRRFSHRVRSRLQFAASSVRACIPEPVQIDRLRRGWLFYRTGTLHSFESAAGQVGCGSEGIREISLLWPWSDLREDKDRLARARRSTRAV